MILKSNFLTQNRASDPCVLSCFIELSAKEFSHGMHLCNNLNVNKQLKVKLFQKHGALMSRPLGNHTSYRSSQLHRICIKLSMLFSFQCFTSFNKRRQHTIKENTLDMHIVKKGKCVYLLHQQNIGTHEKKSKFVSAFSEINRNSASVIRHVSSGWNHRSKKNPHFSFTFSGLQCMYHTTHLLIT